METKEEGGELEGSHINGIPTFLQGTVNEYSTVFNSPGGLPPKRNHEHAINLKQGSNSVG